MYKETKFRSVIKTISWRLLATITTMILVFLFVKKVSIAVSIGIVEIITKMILYYFHERIWGKVHYGKKEVKPYVLWFTGLSGSGKSTVADIVYNKLTKKGIKVERLDGDTIRDIFPKTGFTKKERNSHVKRVGYLASRLERNGIFVVASFISPYKESRDFVRGLCDNFIEIYISTPLEECEKRDVKGLYAKVRKGEIKNFTGVDDPYEIPENPDLKIDTTNITVDKTIKQVMKYIENFVKD